VDPVRGGVPYRKTGKKCLRFTDVGECEEICSETPGCNAFAYGHEELPGTCWLKHQPTKPQCSESSQSQQGWKYHWKPAGQNAWHSWSYNWNLKNRVLTDSETKVAMQYYWRPNDLTSFSRKLVEEESSARRLEREAQRHYYEQLSPTVIDNSVSDEGKTIGRRLTEVNDAGRQVLKSEKDEFYL
jgi:hypothetical protein